MICDLPDWLDKEAWEAFREMRKKKGQRAPLTDVAAKRIIFELDRMRTQGQDTTAVLWRSVTNGWSGVWAHESTKIRQEPKSVHIDAGTRNEFRRQQEALEASQKPEARQAVRAIREKFGLRAKA